MTYVKSPNPRRSWHLLRTWTRVPGRALTVCGLTIEGALEHDGVPAQRTCERCWRVKASREDHAVDQP